MLPSQQNSGPDEKLRRFICVSPVGSAEQQEQQLPDSVSMARVARSG